MSSASKLLQTMNSHNIASDKTHSTRAVSPLEEIIIKEAVEELLREESVSSSPLLSPSPTSSKPTVPTLTPPPMSATKPYVQLCLVQKQEEDQLQLVSQRLVPPISRFSSNGVLDTSRDDSTSVSSAASFAPWKAEFVEEPVMEEPPRLESLLLKDDSFHVWSDQAWWNEEHPNMILLHEHTGLLEHGDSFDSAFDVNVPAAGCGGLWNCKSSGKKLRRVRRGGKENEQVQHHTQQQTRYVVLNE